VWTLHLEFQICGVGDGHVFCIARLPQQDVVGADEDDDLKSEIGKFELRGELASRGTIL
jgi:hypothetical protein